MAEGKKTFRHESLHDGDSVHALLRAIEKGIAKGKLVLQDEDGRMVMHPEGLLHLKLTAAKAAGKHRIDLRISWQVDEPGLEKKKKLEVK